MTLTPRIRGGRARRTEVPLYRENGPSPATVEGITSPDGEEHNPLDGQPPVAVVGNRYKPYTGT